MKILHTSFECYPIAKVGGLADVVGALPKYQNGLGHQTSVIMPFYENDYTESQTFEYVYKSNIKLEHNVHEFSIKKLKSFEIGFDLYLVHIPRLLDRKNVYGYADDIDRYLALQLAILDWMVHLEEKPDVVHCHDHHTGLIPFLMSYVESYKSLRAIPTVLTIHNAQYQGQISYDLLGKLPDFDHKHIGMLDWNNCINPLASAIKCAWRVTTVSPSYMIELQQRANGLETLLSSEKNKCIGILNGIDTTTWDPETDTMLFKNYKIGTVVSGKKANKKWLCDHYKLNVELPLFAFIGRLVGEKSADLLPEVIKESLEATDINILILGSGNPDVEKQLEVLLDKYPRRFNAFIGYNEELSHKVYGGADFLLMPSRVEPCGLNQMYSLRYGTIPIVRRTGGLKDTVVDIGDQGFGICHDQALVWDVCYSIKRANGLYEDQPTFKKIQKQIMKIDHSWNQSAKQYIKEYQSLNQLK